MYISTSRGWQRSALSWKSFPGTLSWSSLIQWSRRIELNRRIFTYLIPETTEIENMLLGNTISLYVFFTIYNIYIYIYIYTYTHAPPLAGLSFLYNLLLQNDFHHRVHHIVDHDVHHEYQPLR